MAKKNKTFLHMKELRRVIKGSGPLAGIRLEVTDGDGYGHSVLAESAQLTWDAEEKRWILTLWGSVT